MAEIADTDWAYAAGFVDGEGCIAITRAFNPGRGRFFYSVQVVVSNRDRPVLEWLLERWGGCLVAVSARAGLAKNCWNWRLSVSAAESFLRGIQPWLHVKRPQCDTALQMITMLRRSRRTLGRIPLPKEWLDEQEQLYWKQRELNHRGTDQFVRKAMHSPRAIHRARLSQA